MASRLTELERSFLKVCSVCGSVGFPDVLAICQICRKHAEHIYCMKIMADEILQEWFCAKCIAENLPLLPKKANTLPLSNKEVPEELTFSTRMYKRAKSVSNAAPETGKEQPHTMRQTPASAVPGSSDKVPVFLQEELTAHPCGNIFNSTPCWKGKFEISGDGTRTYSGVIAFMGIDVASQARELCSGLPETLQLQIKPQGLLLPKKFQQRPPDHSDIALCFSCDQSWQEELNKLVQISLQENAMIAFVGDTKVLIFHSEILPEACRKVRGQPFLWAVFLQQKRAKLIPPSCVLDNKNCKRNAEVPDVHCTLSDMDINMVGGIETGAIDRAIPGSPSGLPRGTVNTPSPEVPPGFSKLLDKNHEESNGRSPTTPVGSVLPAADGFRASASTYTSHQSHNKILTAVRPNRPSPALANRCITYPAPQHLTTEKPQHTRKTE